MDIHFQLNLAKPMAHYVRSCHPNTFVPSHLSLFLSTALSKLIASSPKSNTTAVFQRSFSVVGHAARGQRGTPLVLATRRRKGPSLYPMSADAHGENLA